MATGDKTYFAKSALLSKTIWINIASFIVAAGELTEVINIIPPTWEGAGAAVLALINLALRMFTVRPVAMIGPNDVKAVSVSPAEGSPKKFEA